MTGGLWLGVLAIAVTWAIVFFGIVGVGLAFRRLLGATAASADALPAAFWQGLVLSLLYLQLWHLLLPIDWRAGALLLVAGTTGWAWVRPPVGAWFRGPVGPFRLTLLGAAVLLTVWACDRAIVAPSAYDTGLYHLSGVNWAKAFPIVPGLANLHGRLGFNGSSLLFAAMLDAGPWTGQSTHLANGLLLLVFLLGSLWQLHRVAAGSSPVQPALFGALLLGLCLVLSLNPYFYASLTTDLPAALLLLVALTHGYRFLQPARQGRPVPPDDVADFVLLTSAATAAACVKLSVACVGGLLWLVMAIVWFRRRQEAPATARRGMRWALALSTALALSWSVRSAVLSGYPAYPSAFAPLAVDWKVPAEQVDAERDWVRQFARISFLHNHRRDGDGIWRPEGWGWVPDWYRGTVGDEMGVVHVVLPLSLCGIAVLLWLARRGWRQSTAAWPLLVPLLGGAVFWFATAPRPDFGLCTFWPLAALCWTEAEGTMQAPGARGRGVLIALLIAAVVAGVGLSQRVGAVMATTGNPQVRLALRRVLLATAGKERFGLQPVPVITPDSFMTTSGLRLLVPRDDGRCWSADLLCTPHPASNLRLRGPGDIRNGFVVEGEWQPDRWPNRWGDFLQQWRAGRMNGDQHGQ